MGYHCILLPSLFAAVFLQVGSFAKPLSPRWGDMCVKHSWNAIPKNWESLGRPPSDTTIDLYIALKPQHRNALIDTLYEVSTPGHPKYGAHLSQGQVAQLVAPHPNTLELVNSWLEHHGISSSSISMTHGGNTLTLKGVSVTQANTLLGASYQLYRHVGNSETTIVRTVGYALPAALHGHVLTVAPTTSFVSPPTQWQTARNRPGSAAGGLVKSALGEPATMLSSRKIIDHLTPDILRRMYDTYSYAPFATDRNFLGVVGILGDYPNLADLTAFMLKYRPEAADAMFTVIQVNGGPYDANRASEDQEANLDIQYAEAMAYPTPHIFYSVGRQAADGANDWFISWLEYILKQSSIPQTISMSYTRLEEIFLTKEYAIYVCDLFAQLGARGVSVLFSSGNDGVGLGGCVTNDNEIRFMPNFPPTCPYVTVVGGTMGEEPEVAASFSGGGFSDYFERPPYQIQVVPTFLGNLGSQYRGLYNASGRGIPDISAQAVKFRIFFNGNEQEESGTSGSAPVVAGIISLLNDWKIATGQEPLGFLNPWLYGPAADANAFTDITSGSNPGCNTAGFSAIAGWDPVRSTRLVTTSLS
ncbi:subtilisin-like protein [Lactarius psammicola]|nr:subtilisin-like protein [Lactarius psammicola]